LGTISLQKILLADDEPDIVEIARIALETLGGYEVLACGSGSEVLELVRDFRPDLVVIDVLMPDLGGVEVVDRIRGLQGFETLPFVFLTGLVFEPDLKKLWEAGPVEIITKPFDPMTLAERIERVWEKVDDG
jgi:CheY-like chemotaxis protein